MVIEENLKNTKKYIQINQIPWKLLSINTHHEHFVTFYFEVILNLQKSCRNSWESFHISLGQLFLMIAFGTTTLPGSEGITTDRILVTCWLFFFLVNTVFIILAQICSGHIRLASKHGKVTVTKQYFSEYKLIYRAEKTPGPSFHTSHSFINYLLPTSQEPGIILGLIQRNYTGFPLKVKRSLIPLRCTRDSTSSSSGL